jgi:hypothetical protein
VLPDAQHPAEFAVFLAQARDENARLAAGTAVVTQSPASQMDLLP